uniref:TMF1 regulated nuclear protein 1 n=1 Tax=Coturnix japonica TaxID=93934 RepID=A0A8C2TXI3_COTJA
PSIPNIPPSPSHYTPVPPHPLPLPTPAPPHPSPLPVPPPVAARCIISPPRRSTRTAASGGGGGGGGSSGSLELAAARRRLVAAECRRRAAAELEGRVVQVHCALRHAELRLAARAEALSRLGSSVAQAQLALAAQGQRLQKGLRRRPRPRPGALLAAARALRSCVPWAAGRARRPSVHTPSRRLPAAPRSPA